MVGTQPSLTYPCAGRFAPPEAVALGVMGREGLRQVPRNPWKPGLSWPLQVLGPKPALKEGNPEEDLTADQTNAQAAALYKVSIPGLPGVQAAGGSLVHQGLKREERAVGVWARHQGGLPRSERRVGCGRMSGPPEGTNVTSLPAHSRRRFEDVELYFLNSLRLFVIWNPLNFHMDWGPLGYSDEGDERGGGCLGFARQPGLSFLPPSAPWAEVGAVWGGG